LRTKVSSTALLDLNIFVALAWPAHEHHAAAREWFLNRSRLKWASCPITQLGFVRLLSNPAFSPDALSVRQALELLMKNVNQPSHEFWPDTISASRALKAFADATAGHQQITDAYLLSLAVSHRARLATFDRGLAEFAHHTKIGAHVELVSQVPTRGTSE
jgi:toxin-antitoxin system PIN domain toxin